MANAFYLLLYHACCQSVKVSYHRLGYHDYFWQMHTATYRVKYPCGVHYCKSLKCQPNVFYQESLTHFNTSMTEDDVAYHVHGGFSLLTASG